VVVLASAGRWPPNFGSWKPTDWSALAAWITLLIAVIAASVAWRQLNEARRLRREQAQPYVVIYMEPNAASPRFLDLVLSNLGTTAATDIQLQANPTLQRTSQGGPSEDVWFPDCIPVLVPGQEWRTYWDFGPDRAGSDLPDRHEVVVTYKDSRGREAFEAPAVLDWGAYKHRRWIGVHGMHDAAKALEDLAKTHQKWQESIHGGLAVFVRDGDAKDDQERERCEELLAQHHADRDGAQPEPESADEAQS